MFCCVLKSCNDCYYRASKLWITFCILDQHFRFTKHGVLHILHAAIGDELLESLQIYIIMKTEHFHSVYTIYKITKMRTECLPFPSFPPFSFLWPMWQCCLALVCTPELLPHFETLIPVAGQHAQRVHVNTGCASSPPGTVSK